jgi:hypothetical protein
MPLDHFGTGGKVKNDAHKDALISLASPIFQAQINAFYHFIDKINIKPM